LNQPWLLLLVFDVSTIPEFRGISKAHKVKST